MLGGCVHAEDRHGCIRDLATDVDERTALFVQVRKRRERSIDDTPEIDVEQTTRVANAMPRPGVASFCPWKGDDLSGHRLSSLPENYWLVHDGNVSDRFSLAVGILNPDFSDACMLDALVSRGLAGNARAADSGSFDGQPKREPWRV